MKGLSLEIRVGLLIMVAVGLLVGFVVLLNPNVGDPYTINVEFGNPGNLQAGAPIKVGSIGVGRVGEIRYLGGQEETAEGRRPMIVVQALIERPYADRIYENANFYVTSTSIVGESILGITPGDPDQPALPENAYVQGIDPPRMDLAFAMAFDLLESLHEILTENGEDIRTLLSSAARLLRNLDTLLTDHRERIDRIIENIEQITVDARELMASANEIVSGPRVRRIIRNVDHTLASVRRDIDPILADVRSSMGKVDELLDTVGPQQQEEIQSVIHDASEIAERVNSMVVDAEHIVTHIREGRGTVGALLMDEELYDDIQEMVRDLKHNPWKLFWRE